jgi:hypothetical protein
MRPHRPDFAASTLLVPAMANGLRARREPARGTGWGPRSEENYCIAHFSQAML